MLSVEVHLHELFLGVAEPEFEVEGAPLRVIKNIKKSPHTLLFKLLQVFPIEIILLVIVLDQWLHKRLVVGRREDWLYRKLEDGLSGFLLVGGAFAYNFEAFLDENGEVYEGVIGGAFWLERFKENLGAEKSNGLINNVFTLIQLGCRSSDIRLDWTDSNSTSGAD